MKKVKLLILIVLSLASGLSADELYVRNQRVVQHRVEGKRYVELAPFAKALDRPLSKSGHGWLVGEEPEDLPVLRPGQVWLSGTILRSRFVKGTVSISLDEAVQALGAKLISNPTLHTTDLYLPDE